MRWRGGVDTLFKQKPAYRQAFVRRSAGIAAIPAKRQAFCSYTAARERFAENSCIQAGIYLPPHLFLNYSCVSAGLSQMKAFKTLSRLYLPSAAAPLPPLRLHSTKLPTPIGVSTTSFDILHNLCQLQ